jgi:hypothetical protein
MSLLCGWGETLAHRVNMKVMPKVAATLLVVKAPGQFAKCLTSLVAGAGYEQRCPVEFGVSMEAVVAA